MHTHSARPGSLAPITVCLLFLATLLAGLMSVAAPAAQDRAAPAPLAESGAQPEATLSPLSPHAVAAHPEALAIHTACNQLLQNKAESMRQGRLQLFKKRGEARFIILCKYGEPDVWGIEIRTEAGDSVTAFQPRDGSLREVLRYILDLATRYTGELPWFR